MTGRGLTLLLAGIIGGVTLALALADALEYAATL